MRREKGLAPIYTKNSRVLILGTFPSVKSREKKEYYADNRNRFWKVICEYNGVNMPDSYTKKLDLLYNEDIALWDLINICEIESSKDSSIKNPEFNNLTELLNKTKIELIIFNGKTAFELYKKHYDRLSLDAIVVPHTSAVNATFDSEQWQGALLSVSPTYSKPIQHYIKLCGNNPIYKLKDNEIVLDESYAVLRTCVECGVQSRYLKKAILSYIKREKI